MTEKRQRQALNLRISERQQQRLDALVRKYPILAKHAVALVALTRGLDAIENDPAWFEKADEK